MNERANWIAGLLVCYALAAAGTGCSPSPSAGDAAVPRIKPDPSQVNASVVDAAGYDTALRENRGRVVLVDFWALWCEPCVEYFPHTVELADKHWDKGLAVVSVDLDSPEALDRTVDFLRTNRAGLLTNLISQFGGGSQSMEVFEIPNGAMPCYKIYDRQGQLRHTFNFDPTGGRKFKYQDIEAAVELLLAE